MKLSQREMTLTLVTGTIILFGFSAIVAKPKLDRWRDLSKKKADLVGQIHKNRETIAGRDKWNMKLNDLQKALPEYPADQKMDVQWLSTMDSVASKDGLKILKRQAGEEKIVGDVYELPVECKDWEGSLDSIIRFLFDLQNQGAMLDIRQLQLKPKSGGLFKGYFTLYCAYTKERKNTGEKKANK